MTPWLSRSAALPLAALLAALGMNAAALDRAAEAKAREIVKGLGLEAKAGQALLVGIGGKGRASASSLEMLRGLGPGGIILFGFNIPDNPLDLCPALDAFQSAAFRSAAGLGLFVSIDHEGGSVFRFKGGITRPPSPLETGTRGPEYAELLGRRVGLELGDLGVNMVLGPIVEPLTDDNKEFLDNRSYGRDLANVDRVAAAYIRGLEKAKAIAVAKHFPADGPADPHKSLPRLGIGAGELERIYVARFARAIEAGVEVVMISHVVIEAMDPNNPATMSAAVIARLKKGLGFKGVVLTDDLLMKALALPVAVSAPRAIAAGADLLMLSTLDAALPARDAIVAAVRAGSLSESRLDEAVTRIVALKIEHGLDRPADPASMKARRAGFAARVAESGLLLGAARAKN